MSRAARALFVCALLWTAVIATASANRRGPQLKAGLFLYAAPGLSDPNFARTVIVLLEHGPQGSLGLVVNRPTDRTLREVLDETLGKAGDDVPVYWGGPVQPQAVMALVRAARPGPHARSVLPEVQLTQDLDDVKAALAARDGPLRVRVFSGYAGWGPGQLATEAGRGAWVLEPADAASVFSPEPSRLWERVREILDRVVAE
jgi:putative transcriptional regulator